MPIDSDSTMDGGTPLVSRHQSTTTTQLLRRWGFWLATALLLTAPLLYGLYYTTGKAFAWRGLAAGLGSTGLLLVSSVLAGRCRKSWGVLAALFVAVLYVLHLLYFGVAQFSGRGFDDGFFLSLQTEAIDVAWHQYTRYFGYLALGLLVLWGTLLAHIGQPVRAGRKTAILLAVVSLLFLAKGYRTLPLWQLSTATYNWIEPSQVEVPPKLLARWSGNPLIHLDLPTKSTLHASAATPARNLILLYVESGGVMLKPASNYPGLAPNFQRLMREHGLVPHVHASSYFTMEGLVNTQCGTLLPFEGGNDTMAGFGNRVYRMACLGDVLHKAGYQQVYYSGTSRNFAGAGPFLELHGYDRIVGQEDWAGRGVNQADGDYGISDAVILDQSIKALRQLEAGGKPYNLTIFTIGTHIPGFAYPGCAPYGDGRDRYLNAVHCTDQLVAAWIGKLEAGGFLKHAVLVITGDHQVFSNAQMTALFGADTHDYRLPLIVLGDNVPKAAQQDGAGYDLAPTVVDLLGITTNARFPLGRSLLRTDRHAGYYLSRYNDFLDEKIQFAHGEKIDCANPPADDPRRAPDAAPLSRCERAEVARLLQYQAGMYSRQPPSIACTQDVPLRIRVNRWGIHAEVAGNDISPYFTRIGVGIPPATAGTYAIASNAKGQLVAQWYLQPGDDLRTLLGHADLQAGSLLVVRQPGHKAALPPVQVTPGVTLDGPGIWLFKLGGADQSQLIDHASLAQGFSLAPAVCRTLVTH